jgi:hypothetical protein
MRKERDANNSVEKQIKKQIKEDVGKIRPILERDPDWPLASGGKQAEPTNKGIQEKMRALTRLTKKATYQLFPEFKILSRHGSGTAYGWVHVNIVIPEKIDEISKRRIEQRAQSMLEAVGLEYGTYFTDYGMGLDHMTPCLSTRVNDFSWKSR